MTIENKIRNIMLGAALFAASHNTFASEPTAKAQGEVVIPRVYKNGAQEATEEQITYIIETNEYPHLLMDQDSLQDWYQQKKLINGNGATVLIQPVQGKPGYCVAGLNGKPQLFSVLDKRTNDDELEKSEWIVNLSKIDSDYQYNFLCDLKAEAPKPTAPVVPTTPISPDAPKVELPYLLFSPGASYLQIFATEDEIYNFGGNLRGGSLSLTVQRSDTDWYWGGRILGYFGSGSNLIDINVPATEGPLAGQLVMLGKNDHALTHSGVGLGSIFGYMIPFDKEGRFGVGLELEHGFMLDFDNRKFTESSAHYIDGNVLEGSNISNHSDTIDMQLYTYLTPGLRFKFPVVCGTISGGARTDFSDVDGMINAGIAYCPNKE